METNTSEVHNEIKPQRLWMEILFPNRLNDHREVTRIKVHLTVCFLGLGLMLLVLLPHTWFHREVEPDRITIITFGLRYSASGGYLDSFGASRGQAIRNYVITAYRGTKALIKVGFLILTILLVGFGEFKRGLESAVRPMVWRCIIPIMAIALAGGWMIAKLGAYSNDPPDIAGLPFWTGVISFLERKIITPAFEEVVFRFGLFRTFRFRLNFVFSVLLSGAVFGAAHFGYPDHRKVVICALTGVLLAWPYEQTRSLSASIWCHTLMNVFDFYD